MAKQNTNSSYQQKYDTLQHFDKISIDLPWNDKKNENKFREDVDFFDHVYTMEKEAQEFETIEEQNLSQKMNQLSTNITNQKNESSSLKDIKIEIEKIPNYLTKQNKSFKQMMHQALSIITTATTDNNIEELRKVAILIYKIMFIQTYQLLWTVYLKSGIGQLIIHQQKQLVAYSTNVPIWPKKIKTMLPSKNMDKTNENQIYLNFVNHHLH